MIASSTVTTDRGHFLPYSSGWLCLCRRVTWNKIHILAC